MVDIVKKKNLEVNGLKKEIYLVIPSIELKDAYIEMISEWEQEKGHIYPGAIRPKGLSYEELLKKLNAYKSAETCPAAKVPSDTYFLTDENCRILGAISIRHYLNEELLKFGGHIGYGIRPSERRKGYAGGMLKMALELCKSKGFHKVLIVCDKDNIASAKTIISKGGVYENELAEDNGNIVKRYWVNTDFE